MTDPEVDDLGAYDAEAFFPDGRRPVAPEVLRLRGGERFIASEMLPIMYEQMHAVLDVIVAEQTACEAVQTARQVP